jgi:hypothetical protein
MFTLKLYRRFNGQKIQKTIPVHHVVVIEIGTLNRLLEIHAYAEATPANDVHEVYYLRDAEEGMTAIESDVPGEHQGWGNHWGWGLLENWEGNTSEHYRPASYG